MRTALKRTAARLIVRSGCQLLGAVIVVAYHWHNDIDGLLVSLRTLAELLTQGVMR